MMPGFDGVVSDTDLWNIVNYLRTLDPRRSRGEDRERCAE